MRASAPEQRIQAGRDADVSCRPAEDVTPPPFRGASGARLPRSARPEETWHATEPKRGHG